MSIATEITRLQNAKASIKGSIEAKGVTVPSNAKLDSYSSYVDQIQTGGGGSEERIALLISNALTSLIPSDFTEGISGDPDVTAYTFTSKTRLTSVTFPQRMRTIYDCAFSNCTGLTSFTAPVCTSYFEKTVLVGCNNLQTIDFSNLQTNTTCQGLTYFEHYPTSAPLSSNGFINLTSVTFPQTVSNTFYNVANSYGLANTTSLNSITLPSPVTALTSNGAKGYLYNSGISSAYVSDNVNVIAESMFENCQNLTSVSLPAGLTEIKAKAFKDCPLLTSLTFRGTKAQFATVTLGGLWRFNSPIAIVHCTDGDYSIPIPEQIYWNSYIISDYTFTTSPYGSLNGDVMWWNGETVQCESKAYNQSTNTWTTRTNTKSNGMFEDNGNVYCLNSSTTLMAKYDATASHAGTADVWTTFSAHVPGNSLNTMCKIGSNYYYGTGVTCYKWLGENNGGFETTASVTLPYSDAKSWNIWSPDGQHYFLSGSTSSSTNKKNYLWDDVNQQFVAWNDSNISFQGYTTFMYDNTIYSASGSKIYEVTIDYNNQTITLTESSNFTGVPSFGNNANKFWDFNGTRNLCSITYRPRKTN